MKQYYSVVTFALAIFSPGHLFAEPAASILPSDAAQTCVVSAGEFNTSWSRLTFPQQEANPFSDKEIGPFYDSDSGLIYVFPPNGPAFNASHSAYEDDTGDCAFFQWSSQMFMWLTSSVADSVELPANPQSPNATTDYVFSSEFMYHLVDDHKTLSAQSSLGNSAASLPVRTGKTDDSSAVDSIGQAGSVEGVLFTQLDTDVSKGSSLVYYSVHTNRPYGYVRDAVLSKGGNLPDGLGDFSQFPANVTDTCNSLLYGLTNGFFTFETEASILSLVFFDLYCRDVVLNEVLDFPIQTPKGEMALGEGLEIVRGLNVEVAELGGSLIADVEMAVDYLSMALETKASWVKASSLQHPEKYIRQMGVVPVFDYSQVNYVQTGVETVELALVGMHVVGSVNEHPEMIWATFEHADNAPNASYAYVDQQGNQRVHSDLLARETNSWLISQGNLVDINTEYAKLSGSKIEQVILGMDASPPTNVLRMSPWGSEPTLAAASMNTEMIAVNATAFEALKSAYNVSVADPRLNYVLSGSSWGHDGQFPTGMDVGQIAGTASMANATLETFQQVYQGAISANGCFSCHGTFAAPGQSFDHFSVSHIFSGITKVEK